MSSEASPLTSGMNASDTNAQACARLRAVMALATLTMLVLSWPLWVESDAFPRVPFLNGIPSFPAPLAWGLFGFVIIALLAVAAELCWRVLISATFAVLLLLVLQDQGRFQPWIYQFFVVGLLLASLPSAASLRLIRWWYISVYLHSGLSKLDISFVNELGSLFLDTAVRPFGLVWQSWSDSVRVATILAMPLTEIAIALALALPATRRFGMAGAMLLHAALLGILGPFGLRHSTIVLVWNAAMMVEVFCIFNPDWPPVLRVNQRPGRLFVERLVQGALVVALVLPVGERWGWIDAWPAHALYASHVGKTEVYLHETEIDDWPEGIRNHLQRTTLSAWRRLDLTGWSREVRGVPVYPQSRTCNGLAEALAACYGGRRLVRILQWGPADRWTGVRSRTEKFGLDAIRIQGDQFRLNAHPAGAFLQAEDVGERDQGRPAT